MRIFLTSRGFAQKEVAKSIEEIVGKPLGEIRLLFIPTARYGYFRKNKLIEGLCEAGFSAENILFFDHRYPERFTQKPEMFYTCGGNTFLLQKYMKDSGFLPTLKSWVEEGVPYVGASAGSHLVTKSIAHLVHFDENKVEETDFDGLFLVPFVVICHYGDEKRQKVAAEMRVAGEIVHPICNEELLLAEGEGRLNLTKINCLTGEKTLL